MSSFSIRSTCVNIIRLQQYRLRPSSSSASLPTAGGDKHSALVSDGTKTKRTCYSDRLSAMHVVTAGGRPTVSGEERPESRPRAPRLPTARPPPRRADTMQRRGHRRGTGRAVRRGGQGGPRNPARMKNSPLGKIGLQQVQVRLPLVADHLTAGEAPHRDDHSSRPADESL